MRLDSRSRDWLRHEVSRKRKERLRKDGTVADLELREVIGDELTPEEMTVVLLARGVSCHKVVEFTGVKRSKAHDLRNMYVQAAKRVPHSQYENNERERAVELILSGVSIGEAARRVGAPRETVKKWWYKHQGRKVA